MHDAFDRAVRVVADRVGALLRLNDKLGRIGHELARDRIVRVGAVDQRGHRRRNGDGILRSDLFQRGALFRGRKSGCFEIGKMAQGFWRGVHGSDPEFVMPSHEVVRFEQLNSKTRWR